MFRTAASVAFPVLAFAIALRVAFGLLGMVGLLFGLAWLLLRVICVCGAIYFALALVSPQSARRLREKLGIDEAPRAF